MVSIWSLESLRSLQSLHWWFPLIFWDRWRSFTIATIAEIDSDSIPAIVIVSSRWDRWRSLAKWKFGFHMIVTIAEHFTSYPSDRERSPTIIWKPGFINWVGQSVQEYIALSLFRIDRPTEKAAGNIFLHWPPAQLIRVYCFLLADSCILCFTT